MKLKIKDLQTVWYFFRFYKFQSVLVLMLMIISGFFEMLNLAVLYPIINYGLNVEKSGRILQNFEKLTHHLIADNPFLASCFVLVIITILASAFKFIYYYSSNKLLMRVVGDTQKKVLEKFIAADYNFYVKNQQGNLIYTGTTAPERLAQVIFTTFELLYNLINASFLFSLLLFLSWKVTVFIIGFGMVYIAFIKRFTEDVIHKRARIRLREEQQKNVILNEFITGIKPIKIFQSFHAWKKKYFLAVNTSLGNRFYIRMGKIFPNIFVRFLFFILIAVAGIYLSRLPQQEKVALIPLLGTFGIVINRFLPFANLIGRSVMSIAENIPDTKLVYDLCTHEFPYHPDGQKDIESFKTSISFENVWFKFEGLEDYLLKDVSFSIEQKKVTALVGYSGAGKTTIINLLLKLYLPNKGSIKVDGSNINELNNHSYLSKIGYVSQETFIFNDSFKENIRFGMEDCSDEMIEEAAKLANAHEFIIESSEGYNTQVGDSGIKISGGQRQRVAIARAMLRKPEIIVLDEATSSLDNISEMKIRHAIKNISKHTTVLVVAHRLSTVQDADKIIILKDGEIKEQGSHQELLNNKSSYYDLYMSKQDQIQELNENKERIEAYEAKE